MKPFLLCYNGRMEVIPREAKRITYSTEIRRLKTIPFNEVEKAVVIGTLLGDGCLCENWSKTNYRLKISHSIKQKDYVLWKYNALKRFIISAPYMYEPTQSLTIKTISHHQLTELWTNFYQGNKKVLPSHIEEFLENPTTLAVWFMDDGNVLRDVSGSVRAYHLNTQSFSLKENERLVSALGRVVGIKPTIQKNNDYLRLYIGSRGVERFRKVVDSAIIPSMQYKIG